MTNLKLILLASLIGLTYFLSPHAYAETITSAGPTWENVKQSTSGDWKIIQKDGAYYLELSENFSARRAPDLKLFLSRENASSRTNANGLENTVFISALKSRSGAQSYKLPDGIDHTDFSSLIIYCEAFSKLWAATSL